jgi:hypothetical protein
MPGWRERDRPELALRAENEGVLDQGAAILSRSKIRFACWPAVLSWRQAARLYSLIRPFSTDFRRIRWTSRSTAVTQAGFAVTSGNPPGDALVRPGRVAVDLVPGQDGEQMRLVEDQHAVQELAAQGANEAFTGRVHPGSLARGSVQAGIAV